MIEGQQIKPARIVVAHDWLCGVRGGEHVLERVCGIVEREHEPAGLLTMFDDGSAIGDTVDQWVSSGLLSVSWLNDLPAATKLRRWLLPLYPSAVWGLSRRLAVMHRREGIDLVISTSSAAIKGLRAPPGVPHLCYCFSPARYVWGGALEERDASVKGLLRRAGLKVLGGGFRRWDRKSAANVTQFVAISEHIRRRIRDAYGVESDLIHPPVRTEFFTPDATVPREDFWLCVGALEPYKRADLAMEASIRAGAQLKVVGNGSQKTSLMRRFGRHTNVEFLGRVDDPALRELYRRAKVLIFPQEEDFGIVAVEAQACGLPVVALARGGALDMVQDGRTGVLFQSVSPEAIAEAVARVPSDAAVVCRENAEKFAEARFDREFGARISGMLSGRAHRPRPSACPR
jgi:glycosyltransferase involved in cell wall biosynthesis